MKTHPLTNIKNQQCSCWRQ